MRLMNCFRVLCLTMLTSSMVSADVIIMTENFEDSTFNFTVSDPMFHDGAGDYYTVIPLTFSGNPLGSPAEAVAPYTGFGGSSFFAAEDVDDGGLRPDNRTMSFNVNISNFNTLTFSTLFAASGNAAATPAYDANDGFLIRASIDGAAFQNLLAFEAEGATNQLLRRDTNFDGVGDGFLPSSAFTLFSNLAIAGTGNNLLLEIILQSNDGNVEFAFDNVTVSGNLVVAVPEPSSMAMLILAGSVIGFRRRRA
jgi:PEP-CTERM motif